MYVICRYFRGRRQWYYPKEGEWRFSLCPHSCSYNLRSVALFIAAWMHDQTGHDVWPEKIDAPIQTNSP